MVKDSLLPLQAVKYYSQAYWTARYYSVHAVQPLVAMIGQGYSQELYH
jgi:hypothetical protein